jgi:Fe-S-cluster containining protein
MTGPGARVSLKQLIPAGVCMQCQGCCRFQAQDSPWSPALLAEEQDRLGIVGSKIPLVRDDAADIWYCRYLRVADTACRIYGQRPFECQLYPFLLNRCGKSVFLSLDLHCPYAHQHQQGGSLTEYLDALQQYLEQPLVRQHIKDNPQMIQTYEGVTNLRELAF